MNVFISNIPSSTTEEEISLLLAHDLHSNLFDVESREHGLVLPFNFRITFPAQKRKRDENDDMTRDDIPRPARSLARRLLPSKVIGGHFRRQKKKRNENDDMPHSAQLLLPSKVIGEQFLNLFGEGRPFAGQITVNEVPLQFSADRSPDPLSAHVEALRTRPFIYPDHAEKIEWTKNSLKEIISRTSLQFGWRCRDGTFSVEWEAKECTVKFKHEGRQLHICLPQKTPGAEQAAVIRYSSISTIEESNVGGDASVLLSLDAPPAFEEEGLGPCYLDDIIFLHNGNTFSPNNNRFSIADRNYFRADGKRSPKRIRTSHFWGDEDHLRTVPYTATSVRLSFSSNKDFVVFQHLSAVAGLKKSHSSPFVIESRNLFSKSNLKTVDDWLSSKLDWTVAFQCYGLLRRGLLDPVELWGLRTEVQASIRLYGEEHTNEVLLAFGGNLRTLYRFGGVESDLQSLPDCWAAAYESVTHQFMSAKKQASSDMFQCRHVTFTPTTMLLEGPLPERSNRVLREYASHHHCFLRVSFADEGKCRYHYNRDVDGPAFVKRRFGSLLQHGFELAGVHFEFLAYSSSSLKDRAVWFCRPFDHPEKGRVTAESIRHNLGDFERVIHCPARYGARISQAFTSTDPSIILTPDELRKISDITRNGSIFTDGIGTISEQVADDIWDALRHIPRGKRNHTRPRASPSAYQVRIGGYKGMLSVDYQLQGSVACFRPSMDKFDAPHSLTIEIADVASYPRPVYLNKYLIAILETLGVPPPIFLDLQKQAVAAAKSAEESFLSSAGLLESHGLGTTFKVPMILHRLHKLGMGFDDLDDQFLSRGIRSAIYQVLRELKHRARIPVKGSYTLFGIADVHSFLREGQIFARIDGGGERRYLEGPVLVTRSPCMHPGDVQLVRAIGRPPIGSPFMKDVFPNCVVFSTLGSRSLPSRLGGGDLDGDLYNLITYEELHPLRTVPGAKYDPPLLKEVSWRCTIADIANFVVDYINSDILGILSSRHLIIADQSDLGVEDPDCLALAELHSKAVDFFKSGTPVHIPELPPQKFRQQPDWSMGEGKRHRTHFYTSDKALGQLFRAIELGNAPVNKNNMGRRVTYPQATLLFNSPKARLRRLHDSISLALRPLLQQESITLEPSQTSVKEGLHHFLAYETELRNICTMHTVSSHDKPLSEEEIFMDIILADILDRQKRRDKISRMKNAAVDLVKRVRVELAPPEGDPTSSLYTAWAYWSIAVALQDYFGAHSFGWIALGAIFDIIKAN